jgi:hypothetical protein
MTGFTYHIPDLTDRDLLYKGRRFVAVAVSRDNPFELFGDDYDFVVWDGLYDGVAAVGNVSPDGTYSGELAFSHVEIEIEDAKTMSEFIKHVRKAEEYYFKGCGV